MVAFSNFKAPGFTEAVMQMNFWITHDLAHLNTLSSSYRHFCVYFRQAQAFRSIPTASLTLDILYIEIYWQRSLSQHTDKFGVHRPYESGDITFFVSWPRCRRVTWICWWCPLILTPLLSLGSIGFMELEIIAFVISFPIPIPIPIPRFQCRGLQILYFGLSCYFWQDWSNLGNYIWTYLLQFL